MSHGLWGHALFLASKMDRRTYANVMTRFANGLAANDPLQTLYQLMSGRQPASVTVSTTIYILLTLNENDLLDEVYQHIYGLPKS